ncbi:MAG TPA: tRNA (adenosine(37)-N6)-threonylcarbamoyltransferase complex transferase subunit TsaD, partial [Alphaproteobacteria bacterium]|nr:tRNA (adenosine(37)-N6)-threonylcarbamoyltransferase complex transferase subunit TsaD [Alphaproteobacteria bacterium]
SGGHCQLLIVEGVDRYRRLGTTLDDALGEAFDKAARCLGLGYPGGPALERVALNGNAESYTLPRPMLGRPGCDFSFSGLKTALARQVDSFGHEPDATEIADLAAAFQETVAVVLEDRLRNAAARFRGSGDTLVVAGGVAANRYLRTRLGEVAEAFSLHLVAPPTALCTDNGAMVAWAGIERLRMGLADDLASPARARWPLDDAAPAALGAGVKA